MQTWFSAILMTAKRRGGGAVGVGGCGADVVETGGRTNVDAFLPLKDFSCAGLTLLVRYRNYFSTDIFS